MNNNLGGKKKKKKKKAPKANAFAIGDDSLDISDYNSRP